jgi:hypothetical protein
MTRDGPEMHQRASYAARNLIYYLGSIIVEFAAPWYAMAAPEIVNAVA